MINLWIAGLSAVVGPSLSLGVIRGDPWKFGLKPYGLGERTQAAGPSGQQEQRKERGNGAGEKSRASFVSSPLVT